MTSSRHAASLVYMFRCSLLGVLTAALLSGCSADPTARKELPQCVQDFSEALRWKHLPTAMQFISPEARDAFALALQKAYRGNEMLDFELLALTVQPDGKSAIATVAFSYMTSNDLTLKQGVELQHWSLRDGRWVLLSQVAPDDPGTPASPFAGQGTTKD